MSVDAARTKLIAGKYRLGAALGEGGMGVIYEATHADLGHRVAVKMLRTDIPSVPNAAERFLREARASVQLQSRHAAKVTDVGTTEDGVPFMVIELLEGSDLSSVLDTQGHIPYSRAVTWVLQACDAVAEAHSLGIVHRDLKPGNLFLARGRGGEDTIKVLDFGISKALFGEEGTLSDSNLTETQTIMGTPLYASPEQLRSSKSVDARADIWSLGVILFELMTGQLPFEAETVSGLISSIAAEPAKKVSQCISGIPPELEAIVDRALAKDRNARFATVAEFASALTPFADPGSETLVERIRRLSGAPVVQHSVATTLVAKSDNLRGTDRPVAQTISHTSRRRLGLVALFGGGALLIGGAIFLSQGSIASRPPTAESKSTTARKDSERKAPVRASGENQAQGTPLAPEKASAQVTEESASEQKAAQLRLTIAAEPNDSRLILDGAELVGNPFEARLPADGSMHRLEVHAHGYLSQSRTLIFDRDLNLRFTLRRQKAGPNLKVSAESAPAPRKQAQPSGPDIYEDNPYF
jgi:serine/threonine protein kinase